jgi:hypothetical protein
VHEPVSGGSGEFGQGGERVLVEVLHTSRFGGTLAEENGCPPAQMRKQWIHAPGEG